MNMSVCMSSVKAKLQETKPDRVESFMADIQPEVKKILGNIKNYQVAIQRWNGILNRVHTKYKVLPCEYSNYSNFWKPLKANGKGEECRQWVEFEWHFQVL